MKIHKTTDTLHTLSRMEMATVMMGGSVMESAAMTP
jgi:hypothetical protein